MVKGRAEGREPTPEEEATLAPLPHPTQTKGSRLRPGLRLIMIGDRSLSLNPSLALTEDGTEWVLDVQCRWPADPRHIAEGFAVSALAVEAMREALTGEDGMTVPDDMLFRIMVREVEGEETEEDEAGS